MHASMAAPFSLARWRQALPGVLSMAMVGLAATFLSEHYGGPQLLYALLIGMSLNFLAETPATQAGIDLAARTVLRWGVALLGARITLDQLLAMGWHTASLVVLAVLSTLCFGLWLGRRLQGSTTMGVLCGGAVAICGASAALALAAVLPRDDRLHRFTLLTAAGVTVLSTFSMVSYPLLAGWLGLDALSTGIFLGATIHDVAQVVGAGYMVSPEVGDAATLVKLLRVSLLLPVVAGVSLCLRWQGAAASSHSASVLPWFLAVFVLLMLANSAGCLAPSVTHLMGEISRGCLVSAIAALGTKTSVQQMARLGWRPVLMLVATTLFLATGVGAYLVLAQSA